MITARSFSSSRTRRPSRSSLSEGMPGGTEASRSPITACIVSEGRDALNQMYILNGLNVLNGLNGLDGLDGLHGLHGLTGLDVLNIPTILIR
jgi:hypothetical protein